MRKEIHSDESKRLCPILENWIGAHTKSCAVCNLSHEQYLAYGISSTPPCKEFKEFYNNHFKKCSACNQAQDKWNDDAVPVTDEMRQMVGEMHSGKMPGSGLMKKVAAQLMESLEMTSDDIHKAHEMAEKKVREAANSFRKNPGKKEEK